MQQKISVLWKPSCHLEVGKHEIYAERETLRDAAIGGYKQKIEELHLTHTVPEIDDAVQDAVGLSPEDEVEPGLSMGWALKVQQQGRKSFTPEVRQYLLSKFDEGLQSGTKYNPREIEKQMRYEQNRDGTLKFDQTNI